MSTALHPLDADPVLAGLPADLINAFGLSANRRVKISRGRSIITQGPSASTIYLMSEGWAVSRLQIETGDTQILDILGPGSFAGLSLLNNDPNLGYTAIALQDLKAYRIDINTLQSLSERSPSTREWLVEKLANESHRAQRHITALGQLPARGRLAFAMLRILDIAEQLGSSAEHQTIRLPMTQEEIGNMLGLTNVSISKLMSAFRDEGLIDYGRNRIIVRDVEALSKICGMETERQKLKP